MQILLYAHIRLILTSTLYLGLRLSGEAFANALMIYEFLHNFGETLGFDMDSLPNMDSLQAALLYDQEAEEELLSVVIHLVLVAIEDPGIPFFNKHLTLLGQNLKQADFTNTNISEVMRIFLTARGSDIFLDNTTICRNSYILSPVQLKNSRLLPKSHTYLISLNFRGFFFLWRLAVLF